MQRKADIYYKYTLIYILWMSWGRGNVVLKPVTVVGCHHAYIRRNSSPVKASAVLAG